MKIRSADQVNAITNGIAIIVVIVFAVRIVIAYYINKPVVVGESTIAGIPEYGINMLVDFILMSSLILFCRKIIEWRIKSALEKKAALAREAKEAMRASAFDEEPAPIPKGEGFNFPEMSNEEYIRYLIRKTDLGQAFPHLRTSEAEIIRILGEMEVQISALKYSSFKKEVSAEDIMNKLMTEVCKEPTASLQVSSMGNAKMFSFFMDKEGKYDVFLVLIVTGGRFPDNQNCARFELRKVLRPSWVLTLGALRN